ncbi:hypothetical protein C1I64_05915 [Rathayibacter festucae DSM 15932]|uniref:Uncharacterized protein n=1 Tax=Rathayibacter festucae DSM 15932 TaxID=1328866 RepID=A0A3Q9UXJ2_9MICO|nr:hypothetical protein C1I64_05915 [Rathayibacter festucae DSM 15932]
MPDARRDDARFEEKDGAERGVSRRAAVVAAAWTTPVVSAAVAAPGAAASAPAPVHQGPYVGLFLTAGPRAGEFEVEVRVAGSGPDGAPVTLLTDASVDITTNHDVETWWPGFVVDGPRAATIPIPAGTYTHVGEYVGKDGVLLNISIVRYPSGSRLSRTPAGEFSITATVTVGRVYPGADAVARRYIGFPTQTVTVVV